MKGIYGF